MVYRCFVDNAYNHYPYRSETKFFSSELKVNSGVVVQARLQTQNADCSFFNFLANEKIERSRPRPHRYVTECSSYDLSNKNFPGRGSEIEDDGTCTVTVPDIPTTTNRKLEGVSNDDIAELEAHFGTTLELKLKNLPTASVFSPSPWAGYSWPIFQDSINYVWNTSQPSPAEKYAKAFGLDVASFMDSVSAQNGIDSRRKFNATVCSTDAECFDPDVNTVCAKRADKTSGYCTPTWYAMDQAWTPASILEKEPKCPVTYNGVTFQPMDAKALITDVYYDVDVPYVFTGSRFTGYFNDTIDKYGRHTDSTYRDLNPGFLHVASTYLLGLLNSTFVVDQEAGYGVWNQPVVGFDVYEQTSMTTEKAAKKFYGLDEYIWNQNATSIVYVKSRLSWIKGMMTDDGKVASGPTKDFLSGANYTYLLEMNDAEEIIGGEWVYESNDVHPDFLWLPTSKPAANTTTSIGLSYPKVTKLLEAAAACTESA